MIAARWTGYAGLGVAALALIVGVIATRDDTDRRRGDGGDYDELAEFVRDHQRQAPPPIDVAVLRAQPAGPLAVTVTADAVLIDGVVVTADELLERARDAVALDPKVEVTITTGPDVPYQRIVDTLEALRGVGVTQLGLAATP